VRRAALCEDGGVVWSRWFNVGQVPIPLALPHEAYIRKTAPRGPVPLGESSFWIRDVAAWLFPGRLRRVKVSRLFVGNLPYKATETDIQTFFSEAGFQVDSVNLMRDRFSGEARGFGFVEINDDNVAAQAVSTCNGRQLLGRALVINEARPAERRERPSGGGGDRGGYNGGGGGGRGQRDFGGSKNRW
jgi:cold-inducible RNA-binding protein